MKYLDFEKTEDGIAVITIDCPGTKVNVISSGLMSEVGTMLDNIDNDKSIKGVVLLVQRRTILLPGLICMS